MKLYHKENTMRIKHNYLLGVGTYEYFRSRELDNENTILTVITN